VAAVRPSRRWDQHPGRKSPAALGDGTRARWRCGIVTVTVAAWRGSWLLCTASTAVRPAPRTQVAGGGLAGDRRVRTRRWEHSPGAVCGIVDTATALEGCGRSTPRRRDQHPDAPQPGGDSSQPGAHRDPKPLELTTDRRGPDSSRDEGVDTPSEPHGRRSSHGDGPPLAPPWITVASQHTALPAPALKPFGGRADAHRGAARKKPGANGARLSHPGPDGQLSEAHPKPPTAGPKGHILTVT
jgi:hypothetical protein